MLWYKGWLETQFKLGLTLSIMIAFTILFHVLGAKVSRGGTSAAFGYLSYNIPSFSIVTCTWLAGAGIATQPPFQAVKGLHGSTLFTLSLPVSRFHLLAVRAGIGWLEMAGVIGLQCCGMWFALPFLKGTATSREMFQYAGTLAACASVVYFLSVFLGTFLDDQWRMWGTMLGAAALWWTPRYTSLPISIDILSWSGGSVSALGAQRTVDDDGRVTGAVRILAFGGIEDRKGEGVLILPLSRPAAVTASGDTRACRFDLVEY